MTDVEVKRGIEHALKAFAGRPVGEAAIALFEALGYKSEKRLALTPNTAEQFFATFPQNRQFNAKQALVDEWRTVDFLFQLTDEEVHAAAAGNQRLMFAPQGQWNGTVIESYLFLAITLAKSQYTRTELASVTRAVNRLFPMPVMVLFRHGDTLTLSVINRRLHKRDESKDVLEKVTLIKDISIAAPHRGHVEILFDLTFQALLEKHAFTNWVALHNAWQKTLDSSELNKRFFQEIANWYFWALEHVQFPKDAPKGDDGQDHVSVIRLITRLIFCWFVKEKGLIHEGLFDVRRLEESLKGFAPDDARNKTSVFYRAVLQNLFFATLNTEMDKRAWAKDEQNFMAHSVYRFRECFHEPEAVLALFKAIPFLNGGLFECLDKDLGEGARPRYVRVDGFSRRPTDQAVVPDFLFFGAEREADLSGAYGEARCRRAKVRGLIHTFERYKFTVTENTPIEEEVALDPELSGKVFENLLAAYNPETGDTARKQTGSFYTPREIVEYMVDESLIAYLTAKLGEGGTEPEPRLRHLLAYNDEPHQFTPSEVDALIGAIDHMKTLDPAVGSGAFPMGILHKLVFVIAKLDPANERWREVQRQRAIRETEATFRIGDKDERGRRLADINEVFEQNSSDYGRKLYLIENCIYGVDIQPIAVQIAKMRFFISLIVDQKVDWKGANLGVRPLPNLETKFVAANTLVGLKRPGKQQQLLRNHEIDAKEAELRRVRERHFLARTLANKRKCREQDAQLRAEILQLLRADGWDAFTASKVASWDPYDQNATAKFLDPEWMFGVTSGFDVVLANPPYIDSEAMTRTCPELRELIQHEYSMTRGNWDIYIAFYEIAFRLLASRGVVSFITPDKWISKPFGDELRIQTTDKIYSILKAGRNVFETVHVDAIVSVYVDVRSPGLRIYDYDDGVMVLKRLVAKEMLSPPFAYDWLFSDYIELLTRLESHSARLSDFGICENACATSDAYKLQEFIQEGAKRVGKKRYLRIINTGTIGKYVGKWGQREMVYLGNRYLRPVVEKAQFLEAFPNTYGTKSVKPKLIVKGLNLLDACLDSEGATIPGKSTLIVTSTSTAPDTLKLLLAILNSAVAFFYLREKYPASSYNEGTTFTKEMINKLPVPDLTAEDRKALVELVDRIIAEKLADPTAADTTALERELDNRICRSYHLTPDEIQRGKLK